MRFEWDEKKAKSNLNKHGVSFEEATSVFDDVHADIIPDPDHSTSKEMRELIMGMTVQSRVLVVAMFEKIEGELVRIISARKATRNEESKYWEKRS